MCGINGIPNVHANRGEGASASTRARLGSGNRRSRDSPVELVFNSESFARYPRKRSFPRILGTPQLGRYNCAENRRRKEKRRTLLPRMPTERNDSPNERRLLFPNRISVAVKLKLSFEPFGRVHIRLIVKVFYLHANFWSSTRRNCSLRSCDGCTILENPVSRHAWDEKSNALYFEKRCGSLSLTNGKVERPRFRSHRVSQSFPNSVSIIPDRRFKVIGHY